jgi:hypothetical protein
MPCGRLAESTEELDDDDLLLARMDAGLYTLQQVGVTGAGARGIRL